MVPRPRNRHNDAYLGSTPAERVELSIITKPTEIIFNGDGLDPNTGLQWWNDGYLYPPSLRQPLFQYVRHNRAGHYVWADGHTSPLPWRTMSPPDKPPPHASGSASGSGSGSGSASASGSKIHEEEPGWIPIHLGTFGPSQDLAPGPEGRQTIAQRVSAGYRPPMKTSPSREIELLPAHEHQHPLPSPTPDTAMEHESEKPQSLEAAKVSVFADKPTSPPSFASSRLRVFACGPFDPEQPHAKPRRSRRVAARSPEKETSLPFQADPIDRHRGGGLRRALHLTVTVVGHRCRLGEDGQTRPGCCARSPVRRGQPPPRQQSAADRLRHHSSCGPLEMELLVNWP